MRTCSVLIILLCSLAALGQESPVDHMKELSGREEVLSKNYLSYMSEIAHGSKARKMEKRRNELISSLKQAMNETSRLRPYKGDASLRDAYRSYWAVVLSVLTEDYAKIMDMEEIAERSYDAMEAYLLTQEKAEEKLNSAYDKVVDAFNAFAEKNNVTLTEGGQSKLSKRLNQLGKASSYLNEVFLIYFKSTVQEKLLFDALQANDINALEQTRNSMVKYATEGLSKLDTLKPYNNDASLITACRKVLQFQQSEAQQVNAFSDFLMKQEEFEKTKKSFDNKGAKRTQTDVDAYNKAVDAQNKAAGEYNKVNTDLNNSRAKVMNNWESARRRFMDQHFPHKV